MSGTKYADLPDIDTAPDVYETEDTYPLSETANGASSDDESVLPTRSSRRKSDSNGREELDVSNLIGTEEATKTFRKAEKKRGRTKSQYAYPSSPTSQTDSPNILRQVPLSHRLRSLQTELSALEHELADPSNPLIQREREEENVDPGELIRGLVDVRTRLDKIRKVKEGRARLVGAFLEGNSLPKDQGTKRLDEEDEAMAADDKLNTNSEMQTIITIDRRVNELETIIGSSNMSLDETSPLPSPLLPLITRLNNQLTILTQPRHIDSISRRLKLLLSDLDRASTSQNQSHRRQPSQSSGPTPQPSAIQEQLLPLLTRLAPLVPHIPHILTRLRTLSTLHSSAAEFQNTIEDLEQEQKKMRSTLLQLQEAVHTVETGLDENRDVVKNNVRGLEERVNALLGRLNELRREQKDYLN